MIELFRQHRRLFLLLLLAGVALRLFFIFVFPVTQGDTLIYGDIAKNWMDHHVFGQTIDGEPEATLIRLPGYPAFLAVCFTLFGREHYNAVRFVQLLMDLVSCVLVADLTRRIVSARAALWAFGLAALCPFTANYVALPLTETPSILFAVLAFWFAVRGLDSGLWREWSWCGLAVGAGILMRPDNGILLPVVCGYVVWWYFRANVPTPHVLHSDSTNTVLRGAQRKTVATTVFQSKIKKQKSKIEQGLIAALLVSVVALSPLIPWTIRNLRVFHVFQPLAARYANNPDEDPHLGFQQWTKTWMGEYVSVVEVYWHVTGEEVDPKLLPSRAFDSTEQREKTFDLFDRYNEANSMPPELDQQFADLARERRQHSRFRYYVWLPAARIVDMWLRPRTEMIGIMERWWDYETDPVDFAKALAYGVLNLLYVAAGVLGMIWRRKDVRFAGMLIGFVVLRSVFLGTIENPEPRYTLELFPVLFVFGAALLSSFSQKSKKPRPA